MTHTINVKYLHNCLNQPNFNNSLKKLLNKKNINSVRKISRKKDIFYVREEACQSNVIWQKKRGETRNKTRTSPIAVIVDI